MDIEQLSGTKLGNYEIQSLIGRGGMGVVYKARQISLNRHVAVKILLPSLTSDALFPAFFIRETDALAQLHHPNIVHIYDAGVEENLRFFVMEYIRGKNLHEILKEKVRLESDEAIGIISQAAKGIEHAHLNGIIHRDIKPSNIILDEAGCVRVMDFGLAKILGDESSPSKSGMLIGTLKYMSPEQCRGEEVDERTDIYSLGIVLYEMITGQTPFDASNEAAIIHKIINEPAPELTALTPDVDSGLAKVVLRAMAKEKKNRFSNISEFLRDVWALRALDASLVGTEKTGSSIAVLPFVNISEDPSQEYFCDGLAEELINALTQLKGLRVIARTSAFSFKGRDVDVRDIGRRLDVGTILEGSVRKAENQLRITAQLVDTAGGHHLWSERFDRTMGDVFVIQDEITSAILAKLMPRLLQGHEPKTAKRQTVDPKVYNLYLRGRWYWSKRTANDLKTAAECFEQAIAEDPQYAPAYAGLGDSYIGLALYGPVAPGEVIPQARENSLRALGEYLGVPVKSRWGRFSKKLFRRKSSEEETVLEQRREYFRRYEDLFFPRVSVTGFYDCQVLFPVLGTLRPTEAFPRARMAIQKALEIDDNLADAHASSGIIKEFHEWDWKGAEAEFRRAIELAPGNAYLHLRFAMFLMRTTDFDEALEEIERAIELDPLCLATNAFEGLILYYARRYDQAERSLQKTIRTDKNLPLAHGYLGGVYTQQQRYKEALQEYEIEKAVNRGLSMLFEILMAIVYARMGNPIRARGLLAMLEDKSKPIYTPPYWSALLWFTIGSIDEGFKCLEESCRQRDLWLCNIKVAPEFDSVRSDPRFHALLEKMGPKEEEEPGPHKPADGWPNRIKRLLTKPLIL